MFTFAISLVVVGTTLFVATRIAIGQVPEGDKPAMPVPQLVRGQAGGHDRGQDPEAPGAAPGEVSSLFRDEATDRAREGSETSMWRRLRAVALLAMLLTVLGLIVALVIVIFGAIVLNALRSAVQ